MGAQRAPSRGEHEHGPPGVGDERMVPAEFASESPPRRLLASLGDVIGERAEGVVRVLLLHGSRLGGRRDCTHLPS